MAEQRAFIDTGWARLMAGLVILLVAAALAFLHRDDLFPSDAAGEADDSPLAACIAERTAQIEGMLADGVIGPDQADAFRSRAVDLCEQTAQ